MYYYVLNRFLTYTIYNAPELLTCISVCLNTFVQHDINNWTLKFRRTSIECLQY